MRAEINLVKDDEYLSSIPCLMYYGYGLSIEESIDDLKDTIVNTAKYSYPDLSDLEYLINSGGLILYYKESEYNLTEFITKLYYELDNIRKHGESNT